MKTAKELKNTPVISLTDGRVLGEIKKVYLSSNAANAVAVLLRKEGLIKRKSLVVPRTAVRVFGVDVWLAKNPDVVVELNGLPKADSFIDAGDLCGREVSTDGGTCIGTVGDVLLDDHAKVLGFSLAKVHIEGPLAERGTIARGAVTNLGDEDTAMVIDIALAETMTLDAE